MKSTPAHLRPEAVQATKDRVAELRDDPKRLKATDPRTAHAVKNAEIRAKNRIKVKDDKRRAGFGLAGTAYLDPVLSPDRQNSGVKVNGAEGLVTRGFNMNPAGTGRLIAPEDSHLEVDVTPIGYARAVVEMAQIAMSHGWDCRTGKRASYGDIRANLRQAGIMVREIDPWIAAVCERWYKLLGNKLRVHKAAAPARAIQVKREGRTKSGLRRVTFK